MEVLTVGTGIALVWAVLALAVSWWGSKAFGAKSYRARPAARASRGVLYALGAGMLPGAKESVRTHMGSWAAGVGYHLGIFASLGLLIVALLHLHPPRALAFALGALALLGATCGAALMVKRIADAHLRSFSVPDDFLSNGLTTCFAALAGAAVFGWLPGAASLIGAIVLFAYLPAGKIRHCVFFFPTRIHFGTFFGRRGVLPPAGGAARA